MKVLILGSDGMIGHKIAQSLNDECELILSSRKSISLDTIGVKRGKILFHDLITDNLDSMGFSIEACANAEHPLKDAGYAFSGKLCP